jgi:hypothetical protein
MYSLVTMGFVGLLTMFPKGGSGYQPFPLNYNSNKIENARNKRPSMTQIIEMTVTLRKMTSKVCRRFLQWAL